MLRLKVEIAMPDCLSFQSNRVFYGTSVFPYGLERSGEFTIAQVELLHRHGCAYEALHNGSQSPVTEEEKDFVAVCQGAREPQTAHERVWMRFCQKASAQVSSFSLCDMLAMLHRSLSL